MLRNVYFVVPLFSLSTCQANRGADLWDDQMCTFLTTKVNEMETLLFPDTRVYKTRLYPLLLLCKPLHFLQIAEVDLFSSGGDEPPVFARDFCKAHTPAPFGVKLEHFLELTEQIKASKEQSAVADTEAGAGFALEEISSLLQKSAAGLATDEFDAELRQAQLTLALAEILDAEEESLREEIFFLDEDEIAAINNLQGKSGSTVGNLMNHLEVAKTQLQTSRPESATLRFSAWLHLFRQQTTPQAVKLWMASSREAAGEILKRYRSAGGEHAVPVLNLAMPSQFLESPDYIVQHIENFQESTAQILQGLVDDFEKITTTANYERSSAEFLLPYHTDWADRWETAVDESFPAGSYGRSRITFYLFPNKLLPELLSQSASDVGGADDRYHGLLGILDNGTTS